LKHLSLRQTENESFQVEAKEGRAGGGFRGEAVSCHPVQLPQGERTGSDCDGLTGPETGESHTGASHRIKGDGSSRAGNRNFADLAAQKEFAIGGMIQMEDSRDQPPEAVRCVLRIHGANERRHEKRCSRRHPAANDGNAVNQGERLSQGVASDNP